VRVVPVLVALAALGCGEGRGPSVRDLEIRIEAGRGTVDLGRGFPLSVVRTWDRDLVPGAWSDAALAPLTVRPVATRRREADGRVEETREFLAYAFAMDEVRVPPPRFEAVPRAGGAARAVAGQGISLKVRPALDPRNPGGPEGPGPLPSPARPFPFWIPAVLLGALGLLLLGWRRRRPAPSPGVAPGDRALARLGELRAPMEPGPAHDGLVTILREFLAERFALRTRERTTEEILAAPETGRVLGEEGLRSLSGILARADLVRFAGDRPDAAALERTLVEAEDLVRGAR
jgi:hypothetical protein